MNMPHVHDNDLMSFHRFIAINLEAGDSSFTPEEALDLWRTQNPFRKDLEETKFALDEALRDMESGDRGVPLTIRQRIPKSAEHSCRNMSRHALR